MNQTPLSMVTPSADSWGPAELQALQEPSEEHRPPGHRDEAGIWKEKPRCCP